MNHPKTLREIPDWLRQELLAIDPKLTIRWNERQQRWQVMRRRENSEVPSFLTRQDISEREWWQYVQVFWIEESDGSYRDLDMRIVKALRKGDLHRRGVESFLRELEEEEESVEREKDRPMEEIESEITKEVCAAERGRVSSGRSGSHQIVL